MSYDFIKSGARRLGLYPQLRRAHRRLFDRNSLNALTMDRDLYATFVRHGDLCFDVGANIGHKTEALLSLGAHVIAFEPHPDCADELRYRHPRAVVVQSAVGAAPGFATLHLDEHQTGSSLLADWHGVEVRTQSVLVTTLDDAIVEFGSPVFCKIDVEGFELEVLRGLSQRIPALSFEFHHHRVQEALACLESLTRFGPYEVNLTSKEVAHFLQRRWLSETEASTLVEQELSRRPDLEWGDIFVRYLSSPRRLA